MSPQLIDILFVLATALLIVLSLAVVLAKNPVRAVLCLIFSFLPTSLLYIMMQAPFVGILQILVYGGAIMMLFTFVIMMINPTPLGGEIPGESARPFRLKRATALLLLLAGAGFVIIPPIHRAASELSPAIVSKPGFGGLPSLAELIFKDPANNPLTISFELISFLILVGIIAALNYSRRRQAARVELNSAPTGDN